MKYHSKLLVANICHTEIIICEHFPRRNINNKPAPISSLIKFWQSINEEVLKIEYLIILSQYFGNCTQDFLLCDLMTAFAMFQKYWLSLGRYSTLKSPSFMLCQN